MKAFLYLPVDFIDIGRQKYDEQLRETPTPADAIVIYLYTWIEESTTLNVWRRGE